MSGNLSDTYLLVCLSVLSHLCAVSIDHIQNIYIKQTFLIMSCFRDYCDDQPGYDWSEEVIVKNFGAPSQLIAVLCSADVL